MPINRLKRNVNSRVDWLFAHATRLAEFINTVALMGFGFFMLLGFNDLVLSHPYRKFTYASSKLFWITVCLIGIAQAVAMLRISIKSNQASGILMQISSLIWAAFAITFGLDYPPVSTALPLYALLSFVCITAGHKLINTNKATEVLINKES